MDGERAVAALGGNPELPEGIGRPEWPGHGPLSFIASVRCDELPREGLAEQFPQDGTLLFFCFDGPTDAFVSAADPDTQVGARVLHVPENTAVSPTPAPPDLEPFPRVDLAAETEQSAPDLLLPQTRRALLGDDRDWPDHPRGTPAELKPFLRAFGRLRTRVGHQLGGHVVPVQGPVEYEIAHGALGSSHSWGDRSHDREAERWVLLAQFDSDGDAKMEWGDAGALYWLIRPEDLAARRFDQVRLTVQC